MKKKIETYYQRLIVEDIHRPRYAFLTRLFPWIIGFFFCLQIYYYFHFFHVRSWRVIKYVSYFHQQKFLNVPPKAVMFAYDELLVFIFFLFFVFINFVLSFIAFDSSQRSHIIRRLSEKKVDELDVEKTK